MVFNEKRDECTEYVERRLPRSARPSTLWVKPEFVGLLRWGPGRELRVYTRLYRLALIEALRTIPARANTRYQVKGSYVRLNFRPDPETWHELRRYARTFNVSICFVVSVLLDMVSKNAGVPTPLKIHPRIFTHMELFTCERFGVYSGRVITEVRLRIPPEIRALGAFEYWSRDG